MATRIRFEPPAAGASPAVLALRSELADGMREIACFTAAERNVSVCAGRDSIWAIIRRSGSGGLAVRAAHCPGGPTRIRKLRRQPGDVLRLQVESTIGDQTICFAHTMAELSSLRIRTELTPLLVPFLPRDLYPLGPGEDRVDYSVPANARLLIGWTETPGKRKRK